MLKIIRLMATCLITALVFTTTAWSVSRGVHLEIKNEQAKQLYNALTGSAVQSEGAVGHIYKRGKSILCRYTNVEMDDEHGNLIPNDDPRHYFCSMNINKDGLAMPG